MKAKGRKKPERTNYRDIELLVRVGLNIRAARLAKGLSIESLAANMEVDYSQVQRIELGNTNFTISYLARFAKALDVDMSDLLK